MPVSRTVSHTVSQQQIAACALFLAAKVEEQPRKLEHVIRVAQMIHKTPNFDVMHEVCLLTPVT